MEERLWYIERSSILQVDQFSSRITCWTSFRWTEARLIFLCSDPHLLCFTSNRKGLPPFSWLQHFMGTLISEMRGFRFSRHICNSIGQTYVLTWSVRARMTSSLAQGCLMSDCVWTHVWCSCANLCRCLLVISAGCWEGSTQRMIFYKKSNRFGWNQYIYKEKMHTFWMKIFF